MIDQYIDEVYKRLDQLFVPLDENPLEFSPGRLSEKVAKTRSAIDIISNIEIQLNRYLLVTQREARSASSKIELKKNAMLASDPTVRKERSAKMQESVALAKLASELKDLKVLEGRVEDLKQVLFVVKSKRQDLRDTESRLRDQIGLCKDEIKLGSKWLLHLPPEEDETLESQMAKVVGTSVIDEEIENIDDFLSGID